MTLTVEAALPLIDHLDALPAEERHRLERLALNAANARYRASIWDFACEQVQTVDETEGKILPWPRQKAYLREVLETMHAVPWTVWPKSRRMLLSWAAAVECVHLARYSPNVAVFWQSANEDRAAFAVDKRCAFLESNLRSAPIRRRFKATRTAKGLVGRIEYAHPEGASYIWAVPEGGDVLRSLTPSLIVQDELDFQPSAADAVRATVPLLENKVRLIQITTSNGPRWPVAQMAKEIGFIRWEG